jgi:hypothetical protein
MKKGRIFKIISSILSLICLIVVGITLVDYLMVKNNNEPIFCISREVKENIDGNTNICNGLLYKYYDTVGDGYVSKKFIPIWSKEEDSHE